MVGSGGVSPFGACRTPLSAGNFPVAGMGVGGGLLGVVCASGCPTPLGSPRATLLNVT